MNPLAALVGLGRSVWRLWHGGLVAAVEYAFGHLPVEDDE